MKGISPGFVRTEFRGRAQGVEDIEESKKEYDKLVEVHCGVLSAVYMSSGNDSGVCCYVVLDSPPMQEVLEAEDITSLIVFALSAHPRVDVSN